ncbi:MAG: hypothetical protein IJH86_11065 [Clostridia bacterium]|nr:hypothetical protein [Clostridia bacterium]
MDFIVLGGDARMPALAKRLREGGFEARHMAKPTAEALAGAKGIVVNCPPKCGFTMEDILALASPEARVYLCGPVHWEDARITDLWKDEALQKENAWLTAEGALCAAMRAGDRCLRDARVLVIGWGRIGGALTEMLVALGARVIVASRTQAHRHRAIERGAEAISPEQLPEVLPGIDILFNTAPAMVLDAETLAHANRETLIIDLASLPYGVDLRAAWALGLRAWREPGLPGRYCPESAAAALYRAMRRGGAAHD